MELDKVQLNSYIVNHLKNCIKYNIFEHIIFYGENNTGKTFIIQSFIRDYFKNMKDYKQYIFDFDIIHDRGIKKIRKELKEFCIRKPLKPEYYKFVIIPKTEFLNHDSLCALRRIIELYSLNIRFIFTCNNINSIIPAIVSRCIVFRSEKIKKVEKSTILFDFGINKNQYEFIKSLTHNKNIENFDYINQNYIKIKNEFQFSNEILLNILYKILKEKKEYNRLVELSKILYLNYQLYEQNDLVIFNILNVLNLIKN